MAAAGVILAALYLLWAYQRVFHGEPDDRERLSRVERQGRAGAACAFSWSIVFTGGVPKPMLDRRRAQRRRPHRPCRGTHLQGLQRSRQASVAEDEWRNRGMSVIAQVPFVGPDVQWFAVAIARPRRRAAILLLLACSQRHSGHAAVRWRHPRPQQSPPASSPSSRPLHSSTSTLVGGALAFAHLRDVCHDRGLRRRRGVALVAGPTTCIVATAATVLGRPRPPSLLPAGAVVMGAANDLIVPSLGSRRCHSPSTFGGEQPPAHEEPGEWDEVLHPRWFLFGGLPLRHCSRLTARTGSTNLSEIVTAFDSMIPVDR